MLQLKLVLCLCVFTQSVRCFVFSFPKLNQYPAEKNPGEIVFVTQYLENGNTAEGQQKCKVSPLKSNITSYAGFFTVKTRQTFVSNMFFWYFPAKSGSKSPIILWLQEGIGSSFFYGLFEENGPFYAKPSKGLKERAYTWVNTVSILYIDNPVGAGYSFTTEDSGYATNERNVTSNLLNAVTQFFALFPDLLVNDFYIGGESYAGKYVSALAYNIDKYNHQGVKINLKGITIGNGFWNPKYMEYGKYLHEIGLVDDNGLLQFQTREYEIIGLIKNGKYKTALEKFNLLINADTKSLFHNLTGFTSCFNYRFPHYNFEHGNFDKYVQSDLARRATHVGGSMLHNDNKVEMFLENDIMQFDNRYIQTLLDKKYKILIYNGQLDIIVPYTSTVNYIHNLNWYGANSYTIAKRKFFMVGNEIAGYYKQVDNFIELLVRDAGHLVIRDQPEWALEMITRFTYNKPL